MKNQVICGNNIEALKGMPDNSIDSIVTDPPYGLSFMNKHWDYDVPSVELWRECLRVLKPGGHLLSFAGTRTYHRMTVRIEDAGFEIRDMISWIYGSGFPKSLDISKAIDKMKGSYVKGELSPNSRNSGASPSGCYSEGVQNKTIDIPQSPEAIQWSGWGTSLKPACEPICVARKPVIGTIANNVLTYGTGGLNIDGCRIEVDAKDPNLRPNGINHKYTTDSTFTGNYNRAQTTHVQGRFPANIIFDEISSVLLDEMSGESSGKRPNAEINHLTKNSNGVYSSIQNSIVDKGMKTKRHMDSGGASRFFMNIKKDIADDFLSCYLCANDIKKEICQEKNKPVQNVKKNLQNTEVTTEFTVQKNVTGSLNDKLVLLVSNAENLCDLCVMNFVQNLVLISESPKGVQSPEVLQAIQDFTTSYKNYTLLQSLVYCVEQMANIDITPTTQNLLKLFGSVFRVIENYTKKDTRGAEALKSAPVRFQYVAKASKAERNGGLEGFEPNPKVVKYGIERLNTANKQNNSHPTVKPLKLMQYLVRFVTPKGGICVDPFCGSGTTLMACVKEGFDYIGIEREAEYVKIAEARIEWVKKEVKKIKLSEPSLFDEDVATVTAG